MNIENAKQEFLKFAEKFDNTNPTLVRKIGHSLRVMELSKKIAESLKLTQEQIEIATLIGLLHDIGRFEQVTKTNSTSDIMTKIDHGDLGVEILEKDNYIRKYIKNDEYDNIILKAIKNHNKFKIEDGLSDEELLFAKIIRDADKLDIFYEGVEMFWKKEEEVNDVINSGITPEIMCEFEKQNGTIDHKNIKTKCDRLVSFISLVFDINYKYDFEIIKKENYINKILDKFDFKDEETKEQMMKIREIANQYIEKRNEQN